MKILPVIITTFALLVSCEKSAQSTTNTTSSAAKTTEATPANGAPSPIRMQEPWQQIQRNRL